MHAPGLLAPQPGKPVYRRRYFVDYPASIRLWLHSAPELRTNATRGVQLARRPKNTRARVRTFCQMARSSPGSGLFRAGVVALVVVIIVQIIVFASDPDFFAVLIQLPM